MFRKVVDGEVTLIVCVHVDDLVVAAKGKKTFDAFYTQQPQEVPMNDMGGLSRYVGCRFERDKAKGVVNMTQTAFVDSLVDRFDIQYESQTAASVESDLGPKRSDEIEGIGLTRRRSVVYCGSR